MARATGAGELGFRVIGAMKLASAVMLVLAGFGIFRLLNRDLGETLQHFASVLHLDPENRLVHEIIYRAAGIDRAHLKTIGVGSFVYAGLEGLEGIGLLLRRRWAEYLTVVATGLLLPLEIFEIARKPNPVRIGVLAVNLAILAYLLFRLRQDRHAESRNAVSV